MCKIKNKFTELSLNISELSSLKSLSKLFYGD